MDEITPQLASRSAWKTAAIGFGILTVFSAGWGLTQFQRAEGLARSVVALRQQSESLGAQVKADRVQLTEVAKPDLPVVISFRPAILGSGLVAVFKNVSSKQLEVAATFSSEATGMKRGANLVIPGNGATEIGYGQGWAFAAGQRIQLTNGEFRPAEYQVPGG